MWTGICPPCPQVFRIYSVSRQFVGCFGRIFRQTGQNGSSDNPCFFGTQFALSVSGNLKQNIKDNSIINIKIYRNMKIKPLADRVLVKPAPAEEKTVGGIIIPDSAKEKPLKGEVIATGNGTKDEEMVVKNGDAVLYGKYAGTEIEWEGETYLIMRQSDILAII
jgi:chaperonin GroES